jgi:beta-mannosidase
MTPRPAPRAFALLTLLAGAFAGCASPSAPPAVATAPLTLSSGWQLQAVTKIPDPGEKISRPAYAASGWYNATVPGTVLTSLVNDGVYPEPLYGENNRPDKIPEYLGRLSYWYRTELTVPPAYAGRHIWLNFDGINYLAQVWVNGRQVGDIQGAFVRGVFDITAFVQPGQPAAIAVKIVPPPHPSDHPEKTAAAGTGPNGGILSWDGPTFICTQGWDWIPVIRDRDIGLWQKVTVSASGPVVVVDPFVTSVLHLGNTTTPASATTADLAVEATLRNVTASPQSGLLQGTLGNLSFQIPVSLQPHETRLVTLSPATTPQLRIVAPRLWWPNGYGEPNLYSLRLAFAVDGAVSDTRDVTFGIRQVTYQLDGSANLALSVNGVPVFALGGDWGMDEAMKRESPERLEAQVRLHQLANYNMIRNWVGQSTSEDFYAACDRHGIMLWDEFFQPNPSDSGRADARDGSQDIPNIPLYLANVREKVLRYRNHPSIVLWCGRNEGDPSPPALADGLQAILLELNPDRLYHANSNDGAGVRSGGPYSWRAPAQFYTFPNSEAFKTELGSVSIPTLEAVQAMMPAKDAWPPNNDDWAEHDLARGAAEGRSRTPLYTATIDARFGTATGLPDFVRKSQLAKMYHPATGVLTWMSNPAQPSFVWQIYSHDLEPNASLFGAKKAGEPIHVQMNQNNFHILVVNHTPAALANLTARVRILNLDGSVAYDHLTPVDSAAASAATDLGAIAFPPRLSAVHFVKVELLDSQGRVLSDNFYWRGVAENDLTALASLPLVTLDARITRHDAGGRCLLDVRLTNPAKTVALMAHLQLRRAGSQERVLPVYYSDNYISLLPGESRTITIDAANAALAGDQPLVVLDGWNVTTTARSLPGPVSLAPNTAALVATSAVVH